MSHKKNNNYDRLTESDYLRLDDFNKWMYDNERALSYGLKNRHKYDGDVFNDTYESICDRILFSNIEIKSYYAYFLRSYYNYLSREKTSYKITEDIADKADEDAGDIQERVFDIIKNDLNEMEAELLNAYIAYTSYMEVSRQLSLPYHRVRTGLKKIKIKIKNML